MLTMELTILLGAIAILQLLSTIWLRTRLEASIRAEKDRLLEEYKYEIRAKEQAAKVAEYFSYFFRLKDTSSDEEYRRANQLGWELALWLPSDVYRQVSKAVSHNNSENNILSSLIAVRKLLLSQPGDLSANELFFHAPSARAIEEAMQQLQGSSTSSPSSHEA
jgi:hypothetical protein